MTIEAAARASEQMVDRESPYQGLIPFEVQDADFFFGRSDDRETVVANLFAERLTILYAGSGVGKSSLLQAGVTVDLAARARDNVARRGGPGHAAVIMRDWSGDVRARLESLIANAVATAVEEPLDRLPIFGSTLHERLGEWCDYLGGYLLIMLDQFEDYLLYQPQSDAPDSFEQQLVQAINRPGLRANFLLRSETMRSVGSIASRDAFRRCSRAISASSRSPGARPMRPFVNRSGGGTVGGSPVMGLRLGSRKG